MIERLVPASVSCACSHEDHWGADTLFPEEAAQVARSTPARRAEFTSVRACARRAMTRLGRAPVPVLRGPRGAPLWPPGLVGSMTHCQGVPGLGFDDGDRKFMVSPEGIGLWLGEGAELPPSPTKGTTFETVDGVTGEIRSYRPLDRIRATRGTTTVQLAVSSSGDRSVLRFHQEHLASAEQREQQRAHCRA
ncbi:4'-phosphopantetheinyl transferase family protein [Streptomyces sp. AC154]|uniref:4'-phosphopantetheinyl transferase family protein n=1 Tax=Streptomyces sp. AC154 TaxID=3143184 RepID=UPI003F7F2E52